MKQKIKRDFVHRHMDEESISKYEHMLEKREESAERLKKDMVSHLSTLNDGVIAIFITVMMLEIPFPTSERTYWEFVRTIAVFLVSFFIIADLWYENKKVFRAITEADHMVIVSNFLFLASLALIPVTTKWIMNEPNRYAAMNFGAVYLLTLIMLQLLYYAAVRKRFKDHLKLFLAMILARTGPILIVNAALILLAMYRPEWAVMLYIILPVLSFFRPDKG